MAGRAIARPGRVNDPRHLMRYLKSQAPGATIEDIAKAERVSVAAIRESIARVEAHRGMNSQDEFDLALRDMVISTFPVAKETLHGLLTATELVEIVNPNTGRKRLVKNEDKTTRLEAGRLFKDLVIGLQPKGPLVSNNINQTTQVAQLGNAETQEERLRRLRQQAKEYNALPAEVAGVPAHIDAEDEDEEIDEEED